MDNLGDNIRVDDIKNPKVFIIKGFGELRMQSGSDRINGITLAQLKFMVKTLEDKNGSKSDNGNVKQTSTRTSGADGIRSSKSRKNDKPSTKQESRV